MTLRKNLLKKIASELGFNDLRFISTEALLEEEKRFIDWRDSGFAADMNYLKRENPINARPEYLLKNARTMLMFTANYFSPTPSKPSPEFGRIASYAVGLDYHKVIKKKIKEFIGHPQVADIFNNARFFTDAVPLLEKSFAIKAGLGFRGKNTLLLSRDSGSFNFILEIITDIEFEPDDEVSSASSGTCGNCVRCQDICPTDAFVEPYKLDAGACISYLTIEKRGDIPEKFHKGIGEWVFGCDLCQNVCPYNRKLEKKEKLPEKFPEFNPEKGFGHWLYLPLLLAFDISKSGPWDKNRDGWILEKTSEHYPHFLDQLEKAIKKSRVGDLEKQEKYDFLFHELFCRTALIRPKREGLVRNAEIVLDNC